MVNCEKVKLIDNFDERNSFSQSPSTKSTSCSISLKETSTVTNIFNFAVISFCLFEKASLLPLSVIWDQCNCYHQSNSPVMYDIFGSKVWTLSNYTNCTGVYMVFISWMCTLQVDLVSWLMRWWKWRVVQYSQTDSNGMVLNPLVFHWWNVSHYGAYSFVLIHWNNWYDQYQWNNIYSIGEMHLIMGTEYFGWLQWGWVGVHPP